MTTVSPLLTVCGVPALATGGRFTSLTLTVLPAGALQAPLVSHTSSVNVIVAPARVTSGAVKVGFCAVALLRITAGPLDCTQW